MDGFIELAGGPPIPLVIVGEGRRVHIAGVDRMTACNRRWSWTADLEVSPTCSQCLAAVAHLLAVTEPDERLDRVVEAVESMARRLGTASLFDTPGDQADRVIKALRRRKLHVSSIPVASVVHVRAPGVETDWTRGAQDRVARHWEAIIEGTKLEPADDWLYWHWYA